ncbi:MAG TPA: hypothetical protein VGC76_09720 [Pyrinomonadaceae bacterium]|jgi:hypothetical protein
MKNYKIYTLALCALFIVGCSGLTGKTRTPTETLKALSEASKKKDVDGIKKLLSKGTLQLLDKVALDAKTTPDELLKKEGGAPMKDLPELRGEKIEGDTATVEVKNDITGDFEQMPLVKEDGEWKVAFDKYLDVMKQKLQENMKNNKYPESAPSNTSPENNSAPKTSESNSAANKK